MDEGPKFVADAMLGSLARKLRIFGFDTLYFREGSDSDLERIARVENRIIVTSDRSLVAHSTRAGLTAFGVFGRNDRQRLGSLVEQARGGAVSLRAGPPRCALCNGVLERLARSQVSGSLPESVAMRHRLFYWCSACRKFYWRGGHWSRMRGLSSLLRQQ